MGFFIDAGISEAKCLTLTPGEAISFYLELPKPRLGAGTAPHGFWV